MPELPEVESARLVIERTALGRVIADVDDGDSYECRPHRPGDIRAAMTGRVLTAVHRQGKSMWCDTEETNQSAVPGPVLGIHLGMSGKIVIADGQGGEVEGGDYWQCSTEQAPFLQVERDVAARLRAADQHLTVGRVVDRVRRVTDVP
jgi:formamidopyrimidine-DNA glycosylase